MTVANYSRNDVGNTDGPEYSVQELTSRVHQLFPLIEQYCELHRNYYEKMEEVRQKKEELDTDFSDYQANDVEADNQRLLDAFNAANDQCTWFMEAIHTDEMKLNNKLTIRDRNKYLLPARDRYESFTFSYPYDVDEVCDKMRSYYSEIESMLNSVQSYGYGSIYDLIYEAYAYHRGITNHFQSMLNQEVSRRSSTDQSQYADLVNVIREAENRVQQSFDSESEKWKYAFRAVLYTLFPDQYLREMENAYRNSQPQTNGIGRYFPFGSYVLDISRMTDLPDVQDMLRQYFSSRCRDDLISFDVPADMHRFRSVVLENGSYVSYDIDTLLSKMLANFPAGYVNFSFAVTDGDLSPFDRVRKMINAMPEITGGEIRTGAAELALLLTDYVKELSRRQKSILSINDSLMEYNRNAKVKPVPWKILMIGGFPSGFNEEMLKNLRLLVDHGPKAGMLAVLIYNPQYSSGSRNALLSSFLDNKCIWKRNHYGYSVNSHYPSEAMQFDYGKQELNSNFLSEYSQKLRSQKDSWLSVNSVWNHADISGSTLYGVDIPIGIDDYGKIKYISVGESKGYGEYSNLMISSAYDEWKGNLLRLIIDTAIHCYSSKELRFCLLDFKNDQAFGIFNMNHPSLLSVLLNGNVRNGNEELKRLLGGAEIRKAKIREQYCDTLEEYRSKGYRMTRIIIAVNGIEKLVDKNQDRNLAEENLNLLQQLITEGGKAGMHLVFSADIREMKINCEKILNYAETRMSIRENQDDLSRVFPAVGNGKIEQRKNYVLISDDACEQIPQQIAVPAISRNVHKLVMDETLSRYGLSVKPTRIITGKTIEEEKRLHQDEELLKLIQARKKEND